MRPFKDLKRSCLFKLIYICKNEYMTISFLRPLKRPETSKRSSVHFCKYMTILKIDVSKRPERSDWTPFHFCEYIQIFYTYLQV